MPWAKCQEVSSASTSMHSCSKASCQNIPTLQRTLYIHFRPCWQTLATYAPRHCLSSRKHSSTCRKHTQPQTAEQPMQDPIGVAVHQSAAVRAGCGQQLIQETPLIKPQKGRDPTAWALQLSLAT